MPNSLSILDKSMEGEACRIDRTDDLGDGRSGVDAGGCTRWVLL